MIYDELWRIAAYTPQLSIYVDGIHNSGITRNLASMYEGHVCGTCETVVRILLNHDFMNY